MRFKSYPKELLSATNAAGFELTIQLDKKPFVLVVFKPGTHQTQASVPGS